MFENIFRNISLSKLCYIFLVERPYNKLGKQKKNINQEKIIKYVIYF